MPADRVQETAEKQTHTEQTHNTHTNRLQLYLSVGPARTATHIVPPPGCFQTFVKHPGARPLDGTCVYKDLNVDVISCCAWMHAGIKINTCQTAIAIWPCRMN